MWTLLGRKRTPKYRPYLETHTREGKVKIVTDALGWYPLDAILPFDQLEDATVRLRTYNSANPKDTNTNFYLEILDNPTRQFGRIVQDAKFVPMYKIKYLPGQDVKFNLCDVKNQKRVCGHLAADQLLSIGEWDVTDWRTEFSCYMSGSPQKIMGLHCYAYRWNTPRFVKAFFKGWMSTGTFRAQLDVKCDVENRTDGLDIFLEIVDKSPYTKAWEQADQLKCCSLDDISLGLNTPEVRVCQHFKWLKQTHGCDTYVESYCDSLRLQGKTDPKCACFDLTHELIRTGFNPVNIPVACLPGCKGNGYQTGNMFKAANTPGGCGTSCINSMYFRVRPDNTLEIDDTLDQLCDRKSGGDAPVPDEDSSGGQDSESHSYTAAYALGAVLGVFLLAYIMRHVFKSKN